MSMTTQDQDQNLTPDSETPNDHIDNQDDSSYTEPQTSTPDIDFRALYVESARDRGAKEERIRQLEEALASQNKPAQEDEELDYERLGIDPSVGKALSAVTRAEVTRLRKELQSSIAPLDELSQSFKRQQAITAAEADFYRQYPQLAQYREALTPAVVQTMGNAPNITPQEFARNAFAVIGMQAAMGATQAPSSNPPSNSSVRSTPPARTAKPIPGARTRTLTELERTAMKKNGFDPSKKEDIDSFFAIVEDDTPMVIR